MIQLVYTTILFVSLFYIFYSFIDDAESHIKIDKIKENVQYVEGMLQKQVDKILEKNGVTKSYALKVEKMLKESRIKPFGLNINIYLFLSIAIVFMIYIFSFAKDLLNNWPAALILSVVAFITPYEILKLEVLRKRRSVRRHLPNFFLAISQLLEAVDDIMDVLETALDRIKKPIKGPIKEFIKNYKKGMPLDQCIENLKERFDNPLLIRFCDDIARSIENGTDLKGTIEDNIIKAMNNEKSYMERVTENSGNLSGAILIFGIFLFLVYQIKKLRPEMIGILIHHQIGKIAVNFIIVLIILAVLIMKYSMSYEDSK